MAAAALIDRVSGAWSPLATVTNTELEVAGRKAVDPALVA